jgi:outer membrane protein
MATPARNPASAYHGISNSPFDCLEESSMFKKTLAASVIALACAAPVLAHEPGEVIVRVGVAYQDPDQSMNTGYSKLKESGMAQLGASATFMVAPHVGLGITATSPFSYTLRDRRIHGHGYDHHRIGNIYQASPTIGAQFFFLSATSRVQPYIGAGVNYTAYDTDISHRARDYGYKKIKMDNSWGWALQLGVDVLLSKHWLLNASVQRLEAEGDGKITCRSHSSGGRPFLCANSKWSADIDPWIYSISAGFKF